MKSNYLDYNLPSDFYTFCFLLLGDLKLFSLFKLLGFLKFIDLWNIPLKGLNLSFYIQNFNLFSVKKSLNGIN